MVFLCETKIEVRRLEMVKRRLGFQGCVGVNLIGRKGGLALLWRNPNVVEVFNFSQNHISAWVTTSLGNGKWLFTGFYGEPETLRRSGLWNLLRSFRPSHLVPWLVIRDFNEILYYTEKVRGRQRNESLMCNFRETLDDCNLGNLGHSRDSFTWSNKHESFSYTKERLGKAVTNQRWKRIYDVVKVESLVARSSNHKPILASCERLGVSLKKGVDFSDMRSFVIWKTLAAQRWINFGGAKSIIQTC